MSRQNHFLGERESSLASMEEYLEDLDYKERPSHYRRKHRSRYQEEIPSFSHDYLGDFLSPRYNYIKGESTCHCGCMYKSGDSSRHDRDLIALRQEMDSLYGIFLERTERMTHMELMFRKAINRVGCEIDKIEDKKQRLSILEARIVEKLGYASLATSTAESQNNSTCVFPNHIRPASRSPGDFSFSHNEGDETTTFSFGEIDENVEVGVTSPPIPHTDLDFEEFLHRQQEHPDAKPPSAIKPTDFNLNTHDILMIPFIYDPRKTGCEGHKHFPLVIGEVIAERYRVDVIIASTTFSTVVDCRDLSSKTQVCVKVINNQKETLDQGLDEIKIIKLLQKNWNDLDTKHIVKMLDFFYHREHLFIINELLGENLFMIMSSGEHASLLLLDNLKRMTYQVLVALEYIHSLSLIHADIKPENILVTRSVRKLSRPLQLDFKLCDFGSSCFTTDEPTTYLQSKAYRAPEVLVGGRYDTKIDMWSLGCVILEILNGDVVFLSESVEEALLKIQNVLGELPKEGKLLNMYIEHGSVKNCDKLRMTRSKTLRQIAGHDPLLYDLLKKLLAVDPNLR